MFFYGCASPRVWVMSQFDGGGVIGYQNYAPSSDNGRRIFKLLQCADHKMTYNTVKQGYSAPTTYQAYNYGYGMTSVVPLDGGAYEWGEYHYTCNKRDLNANSTNSEYCEESCKLDKNKRLMTISIEECIHRFCK